MKLTLEELSERYGIRRDWVAKQLGFKHRQQLYVMMDRGFNDRHRAAIEEVIHAAAEELSRFKLKVEK